MFNYYIVFFVVFVFRGCHLTFDSVFYERYVTWCLKRENFDRNLPRNYKIDQCAFGHKTKWFHQRLGYYLENIHLSAFLSAFLVGILSMISYQSINFIGFLFALIIYTDSLMIIMIGSENLVSFILLWWRTKNKSWNY